MNIGNLHFSDTHDQILPAFYAALGEFEGVAKTRRNDHFKSSYADLATVNDEIKPILLKNDLALTQPAITVPHDDGNVSISVDTILLHKSGQYVYTTLQMKSDKNAPQPIGSTTTYARRYSLLALAGIAPEDDDGNSGSGRDNAPKQAQQSAPRTVATAKQATSPAKQSEESKPSELKEIDRNDPSATREAMIKMGMDINAYKNFAAAALGKPLPSDPSAYTKANNDLYDKFVKEGKPTVKIFNNDPVAYGERWKKLNSEPEKKSDIGLNDATSVNTVLGLSLIADEIASKSGFKSGADLVARVKTLCKQDVADSDILDLLTVYQTDVSVMKELTAAVKAESFTDVASFLASRGQ